MKTKSEIENYFASTLNSQLSDLEKRRLLITQKHTYKFFLPFAIGAPLISAIIYFLVQIYYGDQADKNLPLYLFFLMIIVSTIGLWRTSIKRNKAFEPLLAEYNSNVLGGITTFIDTCLSLKPDESISKSDFEQAAIFRKADNFIGSLFTEGCVFGVLLRFSLVRYYSVSRSKSDSSSTDSKSSTHIYFEGVYCVINLATDIQGAIRLREKDVIGDAISNLFAVNTTYLKVETGNTEFDALYTIEATNQGVASKFSKSMYLNCLLDFKKQQNRSVQYFLNSNEIHIAIDGINSKEVNVSNSFDEMIFTKTYINYTNDIVGLAEKLSKIKPI